MRKLFVKRKGVSPILAMALLLAITAIIGAALASTVLKPPTATKPLQLQTTGWASKSQNIVKLTHQGGDPVYMGNVIIKTYIPAGEYTGSTYEIPKSDMAEYMKINGEPVAESDPWGGYSWKTWKAGDTLTIPVDKAFATSIFGLMAPSPGEQFIVEIYYNGQPISSCTITMQP